MFLITHIQGCNSYGPGMAILQSLYYTRCKFCTPLTSMIAANGKKKDHHWIVDEGNGDKINVNIYCISVTQQDVQLAGF